MKPSNEQMHLYGAAMKAVADMTSVNVASAERIVGLQAQIVREVCRMHADAVRGSGVFCDPLALLDAQRRFAEAQAQKAISFWISLCGATAEREDR